VTEEGMEDKRQHKRCVVQNMSINGKMLFANEVKVVDVSMSGISLQSERRFEIGREYLVKLAYEDKVLSLNGIVSWSVLSQQGEGTLGEGIPFYRAGIRFTTVPVEKLNELIEIIESHKRDSSEVDELHKVSGQRLNTRFYIDPPSKTILNLPISYRVRKMSLSGMLVESDHELAIETRLPMEISLNGNGLISFKGRVASCLKGEAEGNARYNIGIEYINMSLENKEKLKDFIRLLENMEEDSSFFVTVQAAYPKK
jgi:hypothetical protein